MSGLKSFDVIKYKAQIVELSPYLNGISPQEFQQHLHFQIDDKVFRIIECESFLLKEIGLSIWVDFGGAPKSSFNDYCQNLLITNLASDFSNVGQFSLHPDTLHFLYKTHVFLPRKAKDIIEVIRFIKDKVIPFFDRSFK